jgi:hypothetical protein
MFWFPTSTGRRFLNGIVRKISSNLTMSSWSRQSLSLKMRRKCWLLFWKKRNSQRNLRNFSCESSQRRWYWANGWKRKTLQTFLTLRQQSQKTKAPNIALSDFIAPKILVKGLYGCFFVTTVLVLMSGRTNSKDLDDYNSIMVKHWLTVLRKRCRIFARKIRKFGVTPQMKS